MDSRRGPKLVCWRKVQQVCQIFAELDGEELAELTETAIQRNGVSEKGDAIYNAVAKLKGIYTFVSYQAIIF